MILLSNFN